MLTGLRDAPERSAELQEASVAAHRVNDAAQAITDSPALGGRMTSFAPDPSMPYLVTAMPWRRVHQEQEAVWPPRPVPRLVEHPVEVPSEWLRLTQAEIGSLTDEDVLM